MTSTLRRVVRALGTLALLAPGLASCSILNVPEDLRWPDDMTGRSFVGVSSGWAFVEADVDLKNGTGPLTNPPGSDVGSSTTDLDPVFGLGLKYFRYLTNNWLVGVIFEHRIFDPESTRPLSADLDIDDFGTNHFILDARYQWDPIDNNRRLRPFAGVQLGYVPEISADGTASYAAIPGNGIPATTEEVSLDGDAFFTLGFVAGASYLIRENLTFDFGAFYEYALNPTKDTITLNPYPSIPGLNEPTTYDGELIERGLYLTAGLSWVF